LINLLNLPAKIRASTKIIPRITEMNITIAREASNFQKRKETVTGKVFWRTNNVINPRISNKRMATIIIASVLQKDLYFTLSLQCLVLPKNRHFKR
jgi:hypothetical protein